MSTQTPHPITPDGRYFIVRGRLWRMSDPSLDDDLRAHLVSELMTARRAVRAALARSDQDAERAARHNVDAAKQALGERGQLWWDGGTPDYNRCLVAATPYAAWFEALP